MSARTCASSLELQNRRPQTPPQPVPLQSEQSEVSRDARVAQQLLEPADRGTAAWRLLGAAFVFEALLWGKVSVINFLMKLILRILKGFQFPLEYFRIITRVFRSLPTIHIFPS
jgi:hypothetical protein